MVVLGVVVERLLREVQTQALVVRPLHLGKEMLVELVGLMRLFSVLVAVGVALAQ
jgi:hypothetical protein